MVCQYCGTEFDQEVCPRCGKSAPPIEEKKQGKSPAAKPRIPKWIWWVLIVGALLAVIGTVAGIYLSDYRNNTWMGGKWGGTSLEVTFRTEDQTFDLAIGEETRLKGNYVYNDEAFQFTAEDGSIYVYHYERMGANRLRLFFTENGEERRITLKRDANMTLPDPNEPASPDTPQEDSSFLPTPEEGPIVEIPQEQPQETPQKPQETPQTPQDTPVVTPQQKPVEKPQVTPDKEPAKEEEPIFSETDVDFEHQLKLPRLYLQTQGGVDVTDRENYVKMTAALSGAGKYDLSATSGRIRGRGNSTWLHFDKKPYRLKFDEKVDFFGMGGNKDWVLLANAFDETMLRSYLAFALAKELNLEYSNDYQYVNVFLNGEYRGVYLLTEQIEEGNSRVDVNTSKTGEVDTGYLIEAIGNFTKVEEERYFTAQWVDGERLDPKKEEFRFYIKSPTAKQCTDQQYTFIKNYVDDVNEAIFKKDWARIESLVNVDSMAKMFLVDQIMLNNDMGYCFYLYKKKGEKLSFGPCWDYDQSCGGSSWGGTTYKGYKTGTSHEWYLSLIEIPEFRALVKKTYNEHASFIHAMPNLVQKTYQNNQFDFDRNNDMWGSLFGDGSKWRRLKELVALKTYDEHLDYLKTWLNNRLEWLEKDLDI